MSHAPPALPRHARRPAARAHRQARAAARRRRCALDALAGPRARRVARDAAARRHRGRRRRRVAGARLSRRRARAPPTQRRAALPRPAALGRSRSRSCGIALLSPRFARARARARCCPSTSRITAVLVARPVVTGGLGARHRRRALRRAPAPQRGRCARGERDRRSRAESRSRIRPSFARARPDAQRDRHGVRHERAQLLDRRRLEGSRRHRRRRRLHAGQPRQGRAARAHARRRRLRVLLAAHRATRTASRCRRSPRSGASATARSTRSTVNDGVPPVPARRRLPSGAAGAGAAADRAALVHPQQEALGRRVPLRRRARARGRFRADRRRDGALVRRERLSPAPDSELARISTSCRLPATRARAERGGRVDHFPIGCWSIYGWFLAVGAVASDRLVWRRRLGSASGDRSRRSDAAASGKALAARESADAVACASSFRRTTSRASSPTLVRSLRAETYAQLRVVLALDRCTDDTASLARAAIAGDERFEIVEIDACPPDWAGKVHAVHVGCHALAAAPPTPTTCCSPTPTRCSRPGASRRRSR